MLPRIPAQLILDLHATSDVLAGIVYDTETGYRVETTLGGPRYHSGHESVVIAAEELFLALADEQGITDPDVRPAAPTLEWAAGFAAAERRRASSVIGDPANLYR